MAFASVKFGVRATGRILEETYTHSPLFPRAFRVVEYPLADVVGLLLRGRRLYWGVGVRGSNILLWYLVMWGSCLLGWYWAVVWLGHFCKEFCLGGRGLDEGKQRTLEFGPPLAMARLAMARLVDARVCVCRLQRHCTLPCIVGKIWSVPRLEHEVAVGLSRPYSGKDLQTMSRGEKRMRGARTAAEHRALVSMRSEYQQCLGL